MIIRYCPQCNEILIKWVELEGTLIAELMCPHCHTKIKITEKENIEVIKK